MAWRTWPLFLVSLPSVLAERSAWPTPTPTRHRFDFDFSFHDQLPPECQTHTSRYDALACWILGLKLNLPDQSFQSGFITLEIRGLQCSNFALQGLGSETSQYRNASAHSQLRVSIRNISASCVASYHVAGLGGNLHAEIGTKPAGTNSSALDWTLALDNDNRMAHLPRPGSVHTHECQAGLAVTDLQFTGSTSARLIDLFRRKISNYISAELNGQTCPLLSTTVDPLLTEFIRQMNSRLEPFIHDGDMDVVPTVMSTTRTLDTNLQSSSAPGHDNTTAPLESHAPLLIRMLRVINDYLTFYLNSGLLQHWFPRTYHGDLDCGWIFSGVNGFVGDLLKPTQGCLLIQVPNTFRSLPALDVPGYARIDMDLESLTLCELDQWSKAAILQPTEAGFLTRLVTSQNLTASFDISANISATGGVFRGPSLQERFQIELSTSSLDAWLRMKMDIYPMVLQNLTVGRFMDAVVDLFGGSPGTESNCLLEVVALLQATDVGTRLWPSGIAIAPRPGRAESFAGHLERDIDGVINNILFLGLRSYPLYISKALEGLMQGPGRRSLNDWLQTSIVPFGPCPDSPSDEVLPRLANFSNLKPLISLNNLLHESGTLAQLNGFANCTSCFLSRALLDLTKPWASGVGEDMLGHSLHIQLDRLELRNAGSVDQLSILLPSTDGTMLHSSLGFGMDRLLMVAKPQIVVSGHADFIPADMTFSFDGSLAVDRIGYNIGSIFEFDMNGLRRLAAANVLQSEQCLASPIIRFELDQVKGNLRDLVLVVNLNASRGSEMRYNVTLDSRQFPEVDDAAAAMADLVATASLDMFSKVARRLEAITSDQCRGATFEPVNMYPEGVNVTGMLMTILAFIVLAQPALALIPKRAETNVSRTRDTPSYSSDDEMIQRFLFDEPTEDTSPVQDQTKALYENDRVSSIARFAILVVIFGTSVLLLSSNLSVGATVDLHALVDDRSLSLPAVFSFSLINTTRDMFQARIYPLLFLVVGFSGIWPYAKLIMLSYAWMASPSRLPPEQRGRYLLALDALGKFSLVDTYVLILFVVAFRFHLSLATDTSLDVYVTPHFGFFGFVLATNLSMMVGHAMVYYHRQGEIQYVNGSVLDRESLLSHAFTVDDSLRKMSKPFRIAFLTVTALAFILVVIGMTLKTFVFEFGGLAGYALGATRRSAYSLVSLGTSLRAATISGDESGWSIVFLQGVYFFCTVFTPYACLLLLSVLMFVPLTLDRQLFILSLAEVVNAWSAMEVFALSVIAAVLQISTFASFMIGDRCYYIEETLKDFMETDDTACFSVEASVSSSAWILVMAALLHSLLVSTVLRLAHIATRERIQRRTKHSRDHLASDLSGFNIVQWMARRMSWSLAADVEPSMGERVDDGPP